MRPPPVSVCNAGWRGGAVGKTENCVVSAHLGYVADDFHTLLDGEPYLPEKTWHDDRTRCRAAGICC